MFALAASFDCSGNHPSGLPDQTITVCNN